MDAELPKHLEVTGVTNQPLLWVRCPLCNGKTGAKVYSDTVPVRFPLYCPTCKKETCIDVVRLKMAVSSK